MTTAVTADAIRLDPADNVATVLRPVAAGEVIDVRAGEESLAVTAAQPIPMCHKICIDPIADGAAVLKYGHSIGRAHRPIAAGEHVHTHNLRSARAVA